MSGVFIFTKNTTMIFDNLPIALPWYNDILLQDRFRPSVNENSIICQLAPYDGVLPFQIRKNSLSEFPTTWKIKCVDGGTLQDYLDGKTDETLIDLSTEIAACFEALTLDGYDYLMVKDAKNALDLIIPTLADGVPAGIYYFECQFTDALWVSELFRVPEDRFTWDRADNGCHYPCLKWSNATDLAPIHYDEGDAEIFYNLLYLDTYLTASEPEYLTVAEKDGREEPIETFVKIIIKYRLSAYVPDYLKIAIFMIHLHDYKYIYLENGTREGTMKNTEITAANSPDGAYSAIEVIFEQDQILIKPQCGETMAAPDDCPPFAEVDDFTMTTTFCEATGAVTVDLGFSPIAGRYGQLYGAVGAGPYIMVKDYISRADLIAGWSGFIDAGSGVTTFKLLLRSFACEYQLSEVSTPTPSC